MPQHEFADRETPMSQSASLSFAEASGGMSIAVGMLPTRRHQVPADWPSPLLRFMAPLTGPNGRPAPRSARPSSSSRPASSHSRRGGDTPLAAA
jgi:hypothetical protein